MSYQIEVENIKCGGCANSITNKLSELEGVEAVEVDIEQGRVEVNGAESSRDSVVAALLGMGYPESGSIEGIKAATAKAKSFVSCAIGRMSD